MTAARVVAVWLFIIGIYIGAPLQIGHVPIPAFLAGAAGIFLLAGNSSHIRRQHVFLLSALALLAMLGAVANIGDGADMSRLKGAVQLLYSVVIAYGLFIELQSWGKERVASLFLTVTLLIAAGCFLEAYTDFKEWSDGFRSYVFYDEVMLNDHISDFRDKVMFGKIRPKLFTMESSYVAIFFLLSVTMWYTLARETPARSWQYFLLVSGAMFLIGSPIVLLTALIPVLNFLFLRENTGASDKTMAHSASSRKLLFVLLYSAALLLVMLTIWRGVGMSHTNTASSSASKATSPGANSVEGSPVIKGNRLEQILKGKDDSFKGRLVAPPLIAYQVLNSTPWFGVGLEAKEQLNSVVLEVFTNLGMRTDIVETSKLGGFVTNNFWLHWIYFGLLGGILMIFWAYRLMKLVGVRHIIYSFLIIAMFMQTMGGYVTPRFWFVGFLIMLLGALHTGPKDAPEIQEYASDTPK